MELQEVLTANQFEEHVQSLMNEMKRRTSAIFVFSGSNMFSAILDFPMIPGKVSMVQVGYWRSRADCLLGRNPDWLVAACTPSELDDQRRDLEVHSEGHGGAELEVTSWKITCDGLGNARESPVYRNASGILLAEHVGSNVAVIAVGRIPPFSARLGPADEESISELIEGWATIIRDAREAHTWAM